MPDSSLPLVYSCSGCSNVAQLANTLALRLDRQGFKVGLLDATTSSSIDQQAPRRRRQERPRLLDGVGFCQAEHTDEGVMGQIGRALRAAEFFS